VTAEGSQILLDAMMFWRIVDSDLAAKTAMEILKSEGNNEKDEKNET